MHQPIQLRTKIRSRASALRITFPIALTAAFAILLAGAAVAAPILGNYPDTSLPLSTDTTVTPDVPPTNTMSINVSTSTDFKGTFTGDPTTGVVQVTNAHPAGTYTVTVTAFDSSGATATKTFTLTATTPVTCNPLGFAAAVDFSAGFGFYLAAVGDFNRDGKQDLALANFSSDNVSILLGDGAGHFSHPRNFGTGDFPYSIVVGDFNGDGRQDIATANYNSRNVSILFGDGAGHFGLSRNFAAGDHPDSIAVGDFNGDGKQDLAVANEQSSSVSILLNNGTGHFSTPTNFNVGDLPASVAVGDFNGDGKQDLVVPHGGVTSGVSILLGDGTGNFGEATNFGGSGSPGSTVVAADFDGDGNQDLAVAGGDRVSIFLGDGTGNFSDPTNFAVFGQGFSSLAVGDFNGDGKQDLAVANWNSDNVSVLLGDGDGSFSAAISLGTFGNAPHSVAVGDFNSDGKQDLAVAKSAETDVAILLRNCPASQITAAGTTCSQFSSGTAETLGSMQYSVNNGLIHRLAPRGFFYWVAVSAPAGNNALRITQTITTDNFDSFFAVIGNGTNVLDFNCVPLQRSITQSGNTVTVRFNAPSAGTYYVAIKFNSQNLIGESAPGPKTTVHYRFITTGVPDSTSGLDLFKSR